MGNKLSLDITYLVDLVLHRSGELLHVAAEIKFDQTLLNRMANRAMSNKNATSVCGPIKLKVVSATKCRIPGGCQ